MTETVSLQRRTRRVLAAGHWEAARQAGTVTLAFDDRHRRRVRLTDDAGQDFLLDLPRAVALDDGDGLELDGGGVLRVVAAPEELCEVRCAGLEHFGRIAWHLGNRHLPVEVAGDVLRLRRDHVIEDMLLGLGAEVTPVRAPFRPEGGAYAPHPHGHAHPSSPAPAED